MSKRSDFPKVEKDFYRTCDGKAIPPKLVEFIRGKTYCEPFYGQGDLEDLLMDIATCTWRSDIRETVGCSKVMDAMCLAKEDVDRCDLTISNPPYTKSVLLPLIDHLVSLKPTWLLLPADMVHNKYFVPYMKGCSKVISIGRLCWFPKDGKRVASTENYSWHFWPKGSLGSGDNIETVFYTRGDN